MQPTRLTILALLATVAARAQATLPLTGVNLSGAEFGTVTGANRGTFGTAYTYPTNAEVDYFLSKGMNTFRLPFKWERLQPTLNSPFNSAEQTRIDNFVNYATARGATVILDPHNFARYVRTGTTETIIGSDANVTSAAFADFWSRLATRYKSNPGVVFNLVNEPHDMGGQLNTTTQRWAAIAQEALTAIRATGATNLLMIPGNGWTGAWSWTPSPSNGTTHYYGTANSVAMPAGISDPLNNFAWDVHLYLDRDKSGTHAEVTNDNATPDPNIGVTRLTAITQWLLANNQKAFLGEFAAPNSLVGSASNQIADEALHSMLNYMESNSAAWLGWAWWGAGPWWGNYMFALDPTNFGQPNQTDRPAMSVLLPHNTPVLPGDANRNGRIDPDDYTLLDRSLAVSRTNPLWHDGDFNHDGTINNQDYLILDTANIQAHGLESVGSLLAHRQSQFGDDYVSELLTTIPEPGVALSSILYPLSSLLLKRRR